MTLPFCDYAVKPSFKSWTVTPVDGKFNVSWVTPDDADVSGWDFRVLYKECASSGVRCATVQSM